MDQMHLNPTFYFITFYFQTTLMLPLSQLLARFKSLSNTEKAKKEIVCEEITRIIGIQITHNQVSFSKNTIFIKTQPIIKSEISLKKEEILKEIKKIQRLSNIIDIK